MQQSGRYPREESTAIPIDHQQDGKTTRAEANRSDQSFAAGGNPNFVIGLFATFLEVNLRLYVIKAAATLFNELERHGIPIEVPNLWAAQRMMNQIRKAQSKLRG